jgi:hypothetical protein
MTMANGLTPKNRSYLQAEARVHSYPQPFGRMRHHRYTGRTVATQEQLGVEAPFRPA